MDQGHKDELRILAPAELKPRMDRVAAVAQQRALREHGIRLTRRHALGLAGLGLLAVGCGSSDDGGSGSGSGTGAAGGGLDGRRLESRLLIYNFSEYVDPRDIRAFERENAGTSVSETYYASTDEMEAKVKAGGGGYDIIVPGQNSIAQLGGGGFLMELDHALLPNLRNLQPQWRDLDYDRGNRYSVVKNWGYTGFYYRRDLLDGEPRTWLEFFELLPEGAKKGRTNMIEGSTLIIGDTMIALGMDPDSEDQADYDRAVEFLKPLAKSITTLDSSTYRADAQAGKIVMGQGWSGDMVQIVAENPNVVAVAPDGPAERWADNWCVLADAPSPVAAHAWIDFMLDPEVALRELEYTGQATPNAGTWAMPGARRYADDPLVNVPEAKLSQYRFILSPNPAVLRLRQAAYEKFRATR